MGAPVGRWSPWRHLRENHPDIRVHEMDLLGDLLGCVDHFKRTIWLDSHLTEVERTCTLAHELGHLALDVVHDGNVQTAPEWKVDRWAASRLIPINCLGRAFTWSTTIAEMADELGVDTKTLRARIRHLTDEEQDMVMLVVLKLRESA